MGKLCIEELDIAFIRVSTYQIHGWRNLFQSGRAQVHVKKTIENYFGLNWQLWRHYLYTSGSQTGCKLPPRGNMRLFGG